ncbi:MAG: hypothetical protein LC107_07255 [Chitinophagales bacterium]|nr:hypothetical protein [Chitinophagales bacterium]
MLGTIFVHLITITLFLVYNKLLVLIFAIVGISATFLPWMYYPKGDASLYGYMGDGLITGFVFLLVAVLALIEIIKKKHILSFKIITSILTLWMGWIGISNIIDVESQKSTFVFDDPIIANAFAGFTQGSGLYVLSIASFGVLIFSLVGLYGMNKNPDMLNDRKASLFIPLGIIILLVGLYLGSRLFTWVSAPDAQEMQAIFKKDVEAMGQCLIVRDYDCFINYNHPMIVQSYGSKSDMEHLLSEAMRTLKDNGGEYKKVTFKDVAQVETNGKNIQAVVNQEVTFLKDNIESIEPQKVLAVSEDGGHSWYYINLSGMDRSKIEKFYPALNPNIKI